MALTDYKASEIFGGVDIASLSDRPNEDGITTPQLKARFDYLIKNMIPLHNSLINALIVLLEDGNETNGHKHNVDNLIDGTTNRLFTEVLKLKLDGIQAQAEVNQNAFSSIKVGGSTGDADSKTATFEIVSGSNIIASIDPLTNKVTLSATGDISTLAVQSILDDIGNYYNSLEVNGALQEIGAILYPSLAKTTPVDADTMLIVDTEASSIYKKITWASIKSAIGSALGSIINALAPKTTPADNDMVVLMDSASSNGSKKLSWANIKATLKAYFDGLYPTMTNANITYYVATTGSNSNDGLSAGSPFLTISYAISKIPKNVRHSININVASGTYNETVVINGHFGSGTINLYGGADLASAPNFKITAFYGYNNNCYVSVTGFEAITTTDNAFYVGVSFSTRLNYCISSSTALSYAGIRSYYASVYVTTCSMSNKNYALYSSYLSRVFSNNFSIGSGNNYGLYATDGSEILKNGGQPSGTISEQVQSGSIIHEAILNPAPLNAPTFVNPSGTTQALGNNSTYLATTAFVVREIKADERPIQLALSDETTTITTGTGKLTFRMPYACKFTKIPRINLNTVSSSGLVTVDIKKNGTTIFSTLLTIDANEKTSVTALTPCVLSSNPTTFADDDEISFDITVAGTGAKGLKATLYIEKV